MKVVKTSLEGAFVIEPDCYQDQRGYFMESWNKNRYREHGIITDFVQDNISFSSYGVLRGLHFQNPHAPGKLVYVLRGEVFDVCVDIRLGSPTYGRWEGAYLSADNKKQLYIPEGFAHGFCVISEYALFAYKCTDYYLPDAELGISWNDPDIGIEWPVENPILSARDLANPALKLIKKDKLFVF